MFAALPVLKGYDLALALHMGEDSGMRGHQRTVPAAAVTAFSVTCTMTALSWRP